MARTEASDRQQWADMAEELAGLGYWHMDVATQTLRWSRNMFRIFGFEPGPAPPVEAASARIHPEDRAESDARLASYLAGDAGEGHTRIIRPDGSIRHTEGRGGCKRDPSGAVVAIYGVVMDVTERHEADMALATHEAHLQLLADSGGDIIVEVDTGGIVRYVSQAIRRLGYEPSQLVGTAATAFVYPQDVEKVQAIMAALFSGAPVDPHRDRTYRLRSPGGEPVWVDGAPTLIRDAGGDVVGVITVLRDITAQKAVAEALAQSATRYRLLTENSTDAIACYDAGAVFTFVSPAATGLMGYEPHEMVGRRTTSFMHSDDVRPVMRVFAAYLAAGPGAPPIRFEYRAYRKDGSEVWLEAHPKAIYGADGRFVEFQDVVRDISERKRVEADLAESEARYRLLAEHVTDIVSCADIEGRLTYLSPSVLHATGYAPAELLGLQMVETIHPDDRARAESYFEAAVRGDRKEGEPLVYRSQHRNGQWNWFECNPTVVCDPAGNPVQFIDVTREITARHHMEEELRAARDAAESAAAVKSDFMANMSHEIRTPLTAVIGFSSLISARTDLDPTARGHADRIAGAGRALLALVNDVLDFSKLEAGRVEISPKPVNPAAIAREALDLFSLQAESKGLALVFDADPALPDCVALDPQAMGQVLLNLLGNAVKFSQGGRVALSLAYQPDAQVLKVRVRDSGPGLSPEQAERLFQRFSQVDASSTRRHGGTGLGLAICKGLVEAMGGQIGVDSVLGQGSTFHFAIPAPRAAALSPAVDGAVDFGVLDGLRLLVVDDNPINRELVRAILSPLGVEVTEAVDGPTGLDAAAGLPFDVILLDIRMPGLDGPQVLARLRAEPGPNQNAPILAFSAEFDADAASGFDAFVAKPLDPAALIHAIARWTAFDTAEETLDAIAS